MEDLARRFEAIGLDERKARETARSERLGVALADVIDEAGVSSVPKSAGVLLYALAATCPAEAQAHRAYVARRIAAGDICRDDQLQAAYAFVSSAKSGRIDDGAFSEACGVGVTVSPETVKSEVEAVLDARADEIARDGYDVSVSALVRDARARPALRWAAGRDVKAALDAGLERRLGARSDWAAKKKEALDAAPKKEGLDAGEGGARTNGSAFCGDVGLLHRPGENPQLSEAIRAAHLAATGGRVVTRFPPEPNGYLHIGHAKAMSLDFRYAAAHGGTCYLRFDDTNPEAEKPEYYAAIRENVAWLGFVPAKETKTSDYFAYLHDVAVRLIEKGKAYVCHMTPAEIEASRGGPDKKGPRYDSPWRNRPVAESLAEFARMRAGAYAEGAATLRLKMDMSSPNPRMWDLVAYRVLYAPHCETGTAWCIYPMYDYSHCLVDSAENITHSMCTTEYVGAREAYYWVVDAAEVYKPVQWEFARLAISHTVLSKRRLTALVQKGVVSGWDDPRLYTLAGLRRRGVPARAVNAFVEDVGVTTVFSIVDARKLDAFVRDELNRCAPRRMAVLDPVAVEIVDGDAGSTAEMPEDPRDPPGAYAMPLGGHVFIDRADFMPAGAPETYFRLTPAQPVGLFRAGVLSYLSHEADADGRVTRIRARLDRAPDAPRPRTFITWVPAAAPAAEVRLYGPLFRSRVPDDAPGGFLADVRPDSLTVVRGARVDPRLLGAAPFASFQFQRVGYFCVDPDSAPGALVFNLTVSLREDPLKDAAA